MDRTSPSPEAASPSRLSALAAAAVGVGLLPDPTAPPPLSSLLGIIAATYTAGGRETQVYLNAFSASPHAWDVAHSLLTVTENDVATALTASGLPTPPGHGSVGSSGLSVYAQHYAAILLEEKIKLEWSSLSAATQESVRNLLWRHLILRCQAMQEAAHTIAAAAAAGAPTPVGVTTGSGPFSRISVVITNKIAAALAAAALLGGDSGSLLDSAFALTAEAPSPSSANGGVFSPGVGVAPGVGAGGSLSPVGEHAPLSPELWRSLAALEVAAALADQRLRMKLPYRRDSDVATALSNRADAVVALCDSVLAPLTAMLLDPARNPHAIPAYAPAWAARAPASAASAPVPISRLRELLAIPMGTPDDYAHPDSDLSAALPPPVTERVLACLQGWSGLVDSAAALLRAGSGFILHTIVSLLAFDPFVESAVGVISDVVSAQVYPRPTHHDDAIVILCKGLATVGARVVRRCFACYGVPDTHEWIAAAAVLARESGDCRPIVPFCAETAADDVARGAVPIACTSDFSHAYLDWAPVAATARLVCSVFVSVAEHETFFLARGSPESLSITNIMVAMLSHPQRTRVSAMIMPFFAALQTVPVQTRAPPLRERMGLVVFNTLVLQLTRPGLAPYWALCQGVNGDVTLPLNPCTMDPYGNLIVTGVDGSAQHSRVGVCAPVTAPPSDQGVELSAETFSPGRAWIEPSPTVHAEFAETTILRSAEYDDPEDVCDLDMYQAQVEEVLGDFYPSLRYSALFLLVKSLGITHPDLDTLQQSGFVAEMPPLVSPLLFADAPASVAAPAHAHVTAHGGSISAGRRLFAGVAFSSYASAILRCLVSVAHHVREHLDAQQQREENSAAAAAASASAAAARAGGTGGAHGVAAAAASTRLLGLAVSEAGARRADNSNNSGSGEGSNGNGGQAAKKLPSYREQAYALRLLFGPLFENLLSLFPSVASAASVVAAADFMGFRGILQHLGRSSGRDQVMLAVLQNAEQQTQQLLSRVAEAGHKRNGGGWGGGSTADEKDVSVSSACYVLVVCRTFSAYSWLLPPILPRLAVPVLSYLYSLALAAAPLPRESAHERFIAINARLSIAASAAAAAAGGLHSPAHALSFASADPSLAVDLALVLDDLRACVLMPSHPAASAFAVVARECAGLIASSVELLAAFFSIFSSHLAASVASHAANPATLHDAEGGLAHVFQPHFPAHSLDDSLTAFTLPCSLSSLSLANVCQALASVLARLPPRHATPAADAASRSIHRLARDTVASGEGWTELVRRAAAAHDATFAARRLAAAAARVVAAAAAGAGAGAAGAAGDAGAAAGGAAGAYEDAAEAAEMQMGVGLLCSSFAGLGLGTGGAGAVSAESPFARFAAAAAAAGTGAGAAATVNPAGAVAATETIASLADAEADPAVATLGFLPEEFSLLDGAAWGLCHSLTAHNLCLQRFVFLSSTTPLGAVLTTPPPLFDELPSPAPWLPPPGTPQAEEGPETGETVRAAAFIIAAASNKSFVGFGLLAPSLARFPFARRGRPMLPSTPGLTVYCGSNAVTERDQIHGGIARTLGSLLPLGGYFGSSGSSGSSGSVLLRRTLSIPSFPSEGVRRNGTEGSYSGGALESTLTWSLDVSFSLLANIIDVCGPGLEGLSNECPLMTAHIYTQFPPPTALFARESPAALAAAAAANANASGIVPGGDAAEASGSHGGVCPTSGALLAPTPHSTLNTMSLTASALNMLSSAVTTYGGRAARHRDYADTLNAVVLHTADVIGAFSPRDPAAAAAHVRGCASGVVPLHADALCALFGLLQAAQDTTPSFDSAPANLAATALAFAQSRPIASPLLYGSGGGAGSGLRPRDITEQMFGIFGPFFLLSRGLLPTITRLIAQCIAEAATDRVLTKRVLDYTTALYTGIEREEALWLQSTTRVRGGSAPWAPAVGAMPDVLPGGATAAVAAAAAGGGSRGVAVSPLSSSGFRFDSEPPVITSPASGPDSVPPSGGLRSRRLGLGGPGRTSGMGLSGGGGSGGNSGGTSCSSSMNANILSPAAAFGGSVVATAMAAGASPRGSSQWVPNEFNASLLATIVPPLLREPDGSLCALDVPPAVLASGVQWPGVAEEGAVRGSLTWRSAAFRPPTKPSLFAALCARASPDGPCPGTGLCGLGRGGAGSCVADTLSRELGVGSDLACGAALGVGGAVVYASAARAGGLLCRTLIFAIGGAPALPRELLSRAASALFALLASASPVLRRDWLRAAFAHPSFPACHITEPQREQVAALTTHLVDVFSGSGSGCGDSFKNHGVAERKFRLYVADLASVMRGPSVPLEGLLDHAVQAAQ